MNVAFLANSFHLSKTKSTDFLIELLKEWFGSVSVIPHKEAWARLPGTKWDLIVSFQHLWAPAELEAFGAERTVLVPMYDDCPHERAFWEPYLGFRILSFSRQLGEDLAAWGHEVMTVQYWQPVPAETAPRQGLRGFFWPRTESLGWNQIRILAASATWDSFHLHVTNAEGARSLPSDEERARFHVEQTSWFEHAHEAKAAVARSTVYFAPRRYEGIGQAFLEAMALGLCVVAPNSATMNEYIVDGETGMLYDPDQPHPLDWSRVEQLGQNARRAAQEGRVRWEASTSALRGFLVSPPRPRPRRLHLWIIFRGRTTALLRALFRVAKKVVGRG